jgi:hypothetical protein
MSEPVWTDAIEALVKSLGEKALSMSWLHGRAEKRYSWMNNWLAIPSIVISTITGVGTVGFGAIGDISYIMGSLSIIVSILGTLNSYFAFAKRAEAHRITSVNYSKLYLQISIEMSLPRLKRMNVKDFLKGVSEQIQRLNEIQPQIPDLVILDYQRKFKDEPNTISKPEITNGLVEIQIFKDPPEVEEPPQHGLVSLPTMVPPPPEPTPTPPTPPPPSKHWK